MGNETKDHEIVQMKLLPKTIRKVEELVVFRGAKSKTQVVVEAISVLHILCRAMMKERARIIIEYPSGTKEKLILP